MANEKVDTTEKVDAIVVPTDLDTKVVNVTCSKTFTVKSFKGADGHKTITLEIDFNNVRLRDVFEGVMAPEVIKAQGSVRAKYATVEDGSTIKKAYGIRATGGLNKAEIENAMISKLSAMTPEERDAFIIEHLTSK